MSVETMTPTDLSIQYLRNEEFAILIPENQATAKVSQINPQSAIVAKRLPNTDVKVKNSTWRIDFEGNTYKSDSLKSYESKLKKALDRGKKQYPTIAKMLMDEEEMRKNFKIVGTIDPEWIDPRQPIEVAIKAASNFFPEEKEALEAWVA